MDYCVRYDNWKLCNFYEPASLKMCDAGQAFPDYVKTNLTESYIQKLYHTQKPADLYISPVVVKRGGLNFAIYDMVNDPFELNNLNIEHFVENSKILNEIRAWAEAEIGRPELPVVGASKVAYVDLVKRASFFKVFVLL